MRRFTTRWMAGVLLGIGGVAGVTPLLAQVPPAYQTVAETAHLRPELLYAIALTESGQGVMTAAPRPWPWTLSIASQPHYYPSREAALDALTEEIRHQQQAHTPRQLGVGLFQIEWRFHAHRFERLDDMLNPYANARVAAEILTEALAASKDDLWAAIGRFHSTTPHLADAYRLRVAERLVGLIGRPVPEGD